MMNPDLDLWSEAVAKALRVDFLCTSEEIYSYASAVYSAVMWGREVDEKNKAICEKDGYIK